MREDAAARLMEIVERLERDAEVTSACGLQVATKLLRMARLDLLCRIHDISDGELQAIGDELKRRQPVAGHRGASAEASALSRTRSVPPRLPIAKQRQHRRPAGRARRNSNRLLPRDLLERIPQKWKPVLRKGRAKSNS